MNLLGWKTLLLFIVDVSIISTERACASTARLIHSHTVLLSCCSRSASDSILCALFDPYIPFHNHSVINVQIVLPLSSVYPHGLMEMQCPPKSTHLEIIVPLCLRGAAQVLLFFHFSDAFRISGKLPPMRLSAVALALLCGKLLCSASRCAPEWNLWIKYSHMDDNLMGYHPIDFLIFGLIESWTIDLSHRLKMCFVAWL